MLSNRKFKTALLYPKLYCRFFALSYLLSINNHPGVLLILTPGKRGGQSLTMEKIFQNGPGLYFIAVFKEMTSIVVQKSSCGAPESVINQVKHAR